eukprot:gnl/TRDRNA2_/TRDRNA2_186577_c0_seq1.p1 gnl/TRDRNA2_/TRDRNA2_186577_c0~~gnl/TRDRNA2_/TRDRNA2_186577_c0_seq1.p1  ORF type:complete len:668 (+),score=156.14 gnl/TRDRNA2_/TRDRNA2_186577_c0_seq1:44-2047(+)
MAAAHIVGVRLAFVATVAKFVVGVVPYATATGTHGLRGGVATIAAHVDAHGANLSAFDVSMDAWWAEFMEDHPFEATLLGETRGSWNNMSYAGQDASLRRSENRLAELEQGFGAALAALGPRDERSITLRVMQLKVAEMRRAFVNRRMDPPIGPIIGVQSTSVSLLVDSVEISSEKDARMYLKRLWGYPSFFAPVSAELKEAAKAERPVVPYKTILESTAADCRSMLPSKDSDGPEKNSLFVDFSKKLRAATKAGKLKENLEATLLKEAADAVRKAVWPAYRELLQTLEGLMPKAGKEAGLSEVTGGKEFYEHRLEMFADGWDPEKLHDLGKKKVAEISQQFCGWAKLHLEAKSAQALMDMARCAAKQGPSKALLERIHKAGFSKHYPATEEGRKAYIDQQKEHMAKMNASLTKPNGEAPPVVLFLKKDVPLLPLKVKEVWSKSAAYSARFVPGNAMSSPVQPSVIYFNLNDMEQMPEAEMEALSYHEGIPGHHMQVARAQSNKLLPRFRRYFEFTPYSEGWAVYSEQILAKRLGGYQSPEAELGRLNRAMVLAVRLVVDTGLHAFKWTRERAQTFYTEHALVPESAAQRAVDRHFAMPGLALAYGLGRTKFEEIHARCAQRMGKSKSASSTWEAELHHELLAHGDLPTPVLDGIVDDWLEEAAHSA